MHFYLISAKIDAFPVVGDVVGATRQSSRSRRRRQWRRLSDGRPHVRRDALVIVSHRKDHRHRFSEVNANKKFQREAGRGLNSTEVANLFLTQQPRVQIPAFPPKIERKIIDVAEVNQRRWLEESGQWLENVDRTHQRDAERGHYVSWSTDNLTTGSYY